MRTYLESKAMAKSLREELAAKNISLSHGECLELVAKQFGFSEWNVLAAKLKIETVVRAPRGGPVSLQPGIPVLRVSSRAVAREFYVDFLGFEFDWGDDAAESQPVYAQVSRGDACLHLAEQSEGGTSGAVLFRMSGLDALQRELQSKPSRFVIPNIRFTPWDSREMDFVDPCGNVLRFWENNPPGVAG